MSTKIAICGAVPSIIIPGGNEHFDGNVFSLEDLCSITIGMEVTDSNLKYVTTQLKVGDWVKFVFKGHGPESYREESGYVECLEYDFDTMYPLIHYFNPKTKEVDTFNSAWLSEWQSLGTMRKEHFFPTLPLQALYNYENIIVRTLFNKYGNSPQWKNTLYDIDKIASTVVSKAPSFKRLDSSNLRRFKKIILQVAPRLKVTRNDFIIASIKGARDLQEIHEDYQAWEDYDQ